MKRFKVVCDECGGTDIHLDAWAAYDVDKQEWVLYSTYDASWCQDCECETEFSYVEIIE